MRFYLRVIVPPLMLLLLAAPGCVSAFEKHFVPESPAAFQPVANTRVIQTGDQSPEDVRIKLYPDAQLIGTSLFTGSAANTNAARKFGGKAGADVVIWSQRYLETRVWTEYTTRSSTTDVSVTTPDTSTSVNTTTPLVVPETHTRDIYEHTALFLRTENAIPAPAN